MKQRDPIRSISLWLAFVALLLTALPSLAAENRLVGRASVIDGDTIEIQGQRIRLHGIDAPESRQQCEDAASNAYRCGQAAAFFLDDLLKGQTVSCVGHSTDRYRRLIAVCTTQNRNGDLFDINATMVRAGHALAYRRYSKDYVQFEKLAAEEQRAIWSGDFIEPWKWRKQAK